MPRYAAAMATVPARFRIKRLYDHLGLGYMHKQYQNDYREDGKR